VYVSQLSLIDFRSYQEADVELSAGVCAFIGPNGQGKTNLVEAIDYVATQSSHRVATDLPLVRAGAAQAIIRATVQRADRQAVLELEINPGGSNRARLNRGAVIRPREMFGIARTVLFSPHDLELVKGDPSARRRFVDTLLVVRQPRFAAVRLDYDRALRQRNSLLKTAGGRATGRRNEAAMATLDVWDGHLAKAGAELLAGRLSLIADLAPHVGVHYADVAQATPKPDRGNEAALAYSTAIEVPSPVDDRVALNEALQAEMGRVRTEELDRGVSLVGPHRDDLVLTLGTMPARGYASHGESWSFALALRLAAFELLRAEGDDPVLILDDVFAELDDLRRERLASVVAKSEQVLVTAAVSADVPADLVDHHYTVREGNVSHA
jgi:DNA replication and repair protein RecF